MKERLYIRPGVGTVIYNEENQILVFRRKDLPLVWQLQQGGMDIGETTTDTLWRELAEETGLLQNDIASVIEYPHWTIYTYPPKTTKEIPDNKCLGQAHFWYFLKLKPGTTIDLTQATDEEFTDYRFVDFSELLTLHNELKLAVYQQLASFFSTEILKQNPSK